MENPTEKTQEVSGIDSFRLRAKEAMGDDEHAKRLTFGELNETDMFLFDMYEEDLLDGERIKEAVREAAAAGERSSALFRGWLANKMAIRMLRRR